MKGTEPRKAAGRRPFLLSMQTFRPWDPEQKWLFPPRVDELAPDGDVAHFVRETTLG